MNIRIDGPHIKHWAHGGPTDLANLVNRSCAAGPATSNRNAIDQLQRIDPPIITRAGERYIDDRDIITSAGISAGIDRALRIVARLASPARSREVRDGIEYAPDPPH